MLLVARELLDHIDRFLDAPIPDWITYNQDQLSVFGPPAAVETKFEKMVETNGEKFGKDIPENFLESFQEELNALSRWIYVNRRNDSNLSRHELRTFLVQCILTYTRTTICLDWIQVRPCAEGLGQCLPVVPHGTSAQQASACLKSSRLWHHFEQLSLKDNIRASGDRNFPPWLLEVGDGAHSSTVELNHHGIDIVRDHEKLIDNTFGTQLNHTTLQSLRKTVILAPTNRTMLEINDKILNRVQSQSFHRMSIDTAIVDSDNSPDMIPPELLHTLTPPGMPPHNLHLKVDGVYMLLRNMDIKQGLCNGTRFVVRDCSSPFVLKCELLHST